MFRHSCKLIVVFAVVAMTAWTAPRVLAQGNVTPDLTGTWVLNPELGDRPGQAGAGGSPDGGGRHGGGGGGMGRRGGGGMGGGGFGGRGGPGGGEMRNPEDMERMRAALDAARRAAARLIIVKGDRGLVITDDEGVSTRLALDGSKETGAVNGVPFESATKWENGKLRVEKKFKGGLKVVELYAVSVEPRLLTISSSFEGGRGGNRTITRVYEQHEPDGR